MASSLDKLRDARDPRQKEAKVFSPGQRLLRKRVLYCMERLTCICRVIRCRNELMQTALRRFLALVGSKPAGVSLQDIAKAQVVASDASVPGQKPSSGWAAHNKTGRACGAILPSGARRPARGICRKHCRRCRFRQLVLRSRYPDHLRRGSRSAKTANSSTAKGRMS